jgi:eukaryotic-like serine/threonine-protein kinase
LAQAETAMALHLGPVARIIVKRAAQKARDESELYALLAEQIDDGKVRAAFLRSVR